MSAFQGPAHTVRRFVLAALCLCVSVSHSAHVAAQTVDQYAVLAKVNEARRANGVPPLAWNAQLAKAAESHSADMARKGFVDEIGSDGRSPRQRVEASGYAQWPSVRIWSESIYAGQSGFDEALDFLLSDDVQRRTLLDRRTREIGIGIGQDALRTYWTLTFGAQPNLLPVFINDDAPVANNLQVAVLLTQEEAVPNGEGTAIGRVVEVRLSNTPDFAGAAWQPWESLIPFTLSRGTGAKTVYVEMRDGAGRTTLTSDRIDYDPTSRGSARPIGPGPVATQAALPAEPPPLPAATPEPTAISLGIVVTLPPATATAPVASTGAPMAAAPGAVVVTIAPTPSPTPQATAQDTTPASVVLDGPPTAEAVAGATVRQFGRDSAGAAPALPEWLIPLYLIAQAAVIAIGLAAFLRRK